MGIQKDLTFLLKSALDAIEMDYRGLKMCELGNQLMRFGKHSTAKEYFKSRGVNHTSIDLNGKDGALKYDLSKPINEWENYFDIITNFGTVEHVSNQEACFDNIHNFCRVGGAMIHALPLKGYYKNHSDYHYVEDYYKKLAAKRNYRTTIIKIVKRRYNKALVCAVLVKQ